MSAAGGVLVLPQLCLCARSLRSFVPFPLISLRHVSPLSEEIFLAYRDPVDFSQQCEHFTNFAEHYVYFVFGVTTAGRFVLSLEHFGDVFDYQPEQPVIRLTQAVMEQKWLPILNWW